MVLVPAGAEKFPPEEDAAECGWCISPPLSFPPDDHCLHVRCLLDTNIDRNVSRHFFYFVFLLRKPGKWFSLFSGGLNVTLENELLKHLNCTTILTGSSQKHFHKSLKSKLCSLLLNIANSLNYFSYSCADNRIYIWSSKGIYKSIFKNVLVWPHNQVFLCCHGYDESLSQDCLSKRKFLSHSEVEIPNAINTVTHCCVTFFEVIISGKAQLRPALKKNNNCDKSEKLTKWEMKQTSPLGQHTNFRLILVSGETPYQLEKSQNNKVRQTVVD